MTSITEINKSLQIRAADVLNSALPRINLSEKPTGFEGAREIPIYAETQQGKEVVALISESKVVFRSGDKYSQPVFFANQDDYDRVALIGGAFLAPPIPEVQRGFRPDPRKLADI